MPDWLRKLFGHPQPVEPALPAREMIRVVHRTKPFKFEGVDRIRVLGEKLVQVVTPIPFDDPEVEEFFAIYLPQHHCREDGSKPDYIHRFTDTDGTYVDFFIQSGAITNLREPLSKYVRRA